MRHDDVAARSAEVAASRPRTVAPETLDCAPMSAARAFTAPILALAALLGACGHRETPHGESDSAALARNVARAGVVEVVAEEAVVRAEVERIVRRNGRAGDLVLRVAHGAGDPALPRIVVGSHSSLAARTAAERAGWRPSAEDRVRRFWIGPFLFAQATDVVVATFEDRERPGVLSTLVFGNEALPVASLLFDLAPPDRPGVEIWRDGLVSLRGPLARDGGIDFVRLERVAIARTRLLADALDLPANAFGVRGVRATSVLEDDARRYLARSARAREVVGSWALQDGGFPLVDLVLVARGEDLLAFGDVDDLFHVDPVRRRAVAFCAPDLDDGGAAPALATLLEALGPPSEPWMAHAAALDASWTSFGRGLDDVLAEIGAPARAMDLAFLASADADGRVSPFVLGPLRASVWRCLRETVGGARLRALWRGEQPLVVDAAFTSAWRVWCTGRIGDRGARVEAQRVARRAQILAGPTWRGLGIEESGDPALARLGSAASEATFELARTLGADAASVHASGEDVPGRPRSFGRDPSRALTLAEGDVRVFFALRAARERELRPALVLHVLASGSGALSGSWTRRDAEDWQSFFARYAAYVEHAGRLCDLAGCELFVLGAGIPAVAYETGGGRRAEPRELEWRRAGWERVIGAARGAFGGALAYAASSAREIEGVAFWPSLDLVGLDLCPTLDYVPWDPAVDSAALLRGLAGRELADAAAAAARFERGLVVVQAGVTADDRFAAAAPGTAPAVGSRERALAALSDSLRAPDVRERLRGVFVWRLGADPRDQGASPRDFVLSDDASRAAARALLAAL